MHIPTVSYGYIVQAFSLPFMTHHSPSLWQTISTTTDDNNYKSKIPEDSDEKHYYYGYNILRQLIYSGPRIFTLGLSGFFYRPSYGSASSLGAG